MRTLSNPPVDELPVDEVDVVVTGGAGFIGANLCRLLGTTAGIGRVVAFDDLSTGRANNLDGTDTELIEGSILDPEALDAAVGPADAVIHLAARPSVARSVADPVTSHLVNATGTLNVLEAARRDGSRSVAVASSSSVYGANPALPKHEALRPQPISPYAVSKLATEAYALSYRHCYGLDVCAFRFFNVFGPLQPAGHAYAAVIPAFVDAALAGRPLPVHGDGTQSRDFTYVDTVASVLTASVLDRTSCPDPVNLAFGTRTDLLGVIAVLEGLLGRELEVDHQPTRPGDVPHSQASNDRLSSLFPSIDPVDLRTGLAATVEWMSELAPVS
ncbi:MAG: NAD-dependent epimerase/dehydratase family protein [Acidimicrobiia bacterium]|nr:NAD-dependent epimerase/dehydratase family protein [Acidimicrobiia bacterium]